MREGYSRPIQGMKSEPEESTSQLKFGYVARGRVPTGNQCGT